MQSMLAEIAAYKRQEVKERKHQISQTQMEKELELGDGSFLRALSGNDLKIIAEIKPSSPSKGVLKTEFDAEKLTEMYCRYACALSVLTDYKYFKGSIELLKKVAKVASCPILCKDFILDPFQIFEARMAGAQAVLLIVKMLSVEELSNLYKLTVKLNMTPVVEVQNEVELERALVLSPQIVLINNRNLDSLAIDLETTKRLAPLVPPEVIAVSASGIDGRADIEALTDFCSCFLVGSTLMQANDVEAKLRELLRK